MKKTLFNLFVIFFITVFCILGTWQLYRLQWKLNLIDEINIGLKSEPVRYSIKVTKNFQRIKVEGKFNYNKQIYLYSLNDNGKPGFDVITPLITSKNEYLLVNRGWIEKEYKGKKIINVFKKNEITGILKKNTKPNIFKPKNDIINNVWFSVNLDDLREFTGIDFKNFVIFMENNEGGTPKIKTINANLTNNHLKYALTWYSVALSILIYFLYFRKKQ